MVKQARSCIAQSAQKNHHRVPSMYMAYGPRGRFENQIVPENLS